MLSHVLLPILLFSLTATALPITKPNLTPRAPQSSISSLLTDTPLTPTYDPSQFEDPESTSDSEEDDDGTTNVASSFSPAIQGSPFANGNTLSVRNPQNDDGGDTNVASSFSPAIQDSPFLNNNNVNIAGEGAAENPECQASGSSEEGGDDVNVASSFSPSIQDSPFLNCNDVNLLSGKKIIGGNLLGIGLPRKE